ncbi:MAG: glycoside hydrolase family 15 protein [Phototrophicaceae bacterium]
MKNLRQISIAIIRDNQAQSGAYVASPTFSQYGYSWFRDGMWIAHSMDCVGQHDSATAFHRWAARTLELHAHKIEQLLEKIQTGQTLVESDYLPTRFMLDGAIGQENWTDFQLDGYGAWLWGAVQHCQNHKPDLWQEIRPAVALLVKYLETIWHYPNYDCWEEFRHEQHLSTFAALYGGLKAVADYDPELIPTHLPGRIKAFALSYGVTDDGNFMKFIANPEVDASLLWTAIPFGLVTVDHLIFQQTLQKIETDLYRKGGGVYRYCADTYFGGGEWLLLATWLAWVYIELGRLDEAQSIMQWVSSQADENNHLPEQVEDHLLNEGYFDGWVENWGTSASPLLWSHAMYLIVQSLLKEKSL